MYCKHRVVPKKVEFTCTYNVIVVIIIIASTPRTGVAVSDTLVHHVYLRRFC